MTFSPDLYTSKNPDDITGETGAIYFTWKKKVEISWVVRSFCSQSR